MSLAPIHLPQHAFTSTLTDEEGQPAHHEQVSGINIYIVILTAILFFSVLAWFNFVLAFYGTLTTTDCNHVDQTWNTLGFAILWTVIVIGIYYAMNYFGVLNSDTNTSDKHPLLREDSSTPSDYLGRVDIGAV